MVLWAGQREMLIFFSPATCQSKNMSLIMHNIEKDFKINAFKRNLNYRALGSFKTFNIVLVLKSIRFSQMESVQMDGEYQAYTFHLHLFCWMIIPCHAGKSKQTNKKNVLNAVLTKFAALCAKERWNSSWHLRETTFNKKVLDRIFNRQPFQSNKLQTRHSFYYYIQSFSSNHIHQNTEKLSGREQ